MIFQQVGPHHQRYFSRERQFQPFRQSRWTIACPYINPVGPDRPISAGAIFGRTGDDLGILHSNNLETLLLDLSLIIFFVVSDHRVDSYSPGSWRDAGRGCCVIGGQATPSNWRYKPIEKVDLLDTRSTCRS